MIGPKIRVTGFESENLAGDAWRVYPQKLDRSTSAAGGIQTQAVCGLCFADEASQT